MGIFKFVREAGEKVGLGESPSEAAEEAEKEVELRELREGNKILRLLIALDLGIDSLYTEIFEASRPLLEGPDKIYPGQVPRIPQA